MWHAKLGPGMQPQCWQADTGAMWQVWNPILAVKPSAEAVCAKSRSHSQCKVSGKCYIEKIWIYNHIFKGLYFPEYVKPAFCMSCADHNLKSLKDMHEIKSFCDNMLVFKII